MFVDLDGLHDELSALAERQKFSGVVRIDGPEEVVFEEGFGLASYTWAVPVTPEIRFDTASITKLFTAVAVLQQVEAGAFGLDTGVIDYLGLEGTAITPKATVHHMLSHTSGIADDADEEAGEDYEALFAARPNYQVRQAADLLPGFVDKPGNFAPGTGCRYCNVSYVLLGLMVEKATGTAYRDYVTEHVFARAEMDRSGFFEMDRVVPGVAEGVDPVLDGEQIVGSRARHLLSPAGRHTRRWSARDAGDLMAFHSALVGGRLVSAGLVEAMLARHGRHCEMERGVHWTGYGFECETDAGGTVRSYWKEGINVGVSGMLRHYVDPELTVVVLSNRQDGAWGPIGTIDERVGGVLGGCATG